MNEIKVMKKYRIDSKILERYPLSRDVTRKSGQFEDGKSSTIEINCRPSSQVGLIEHVIEEVEIGNRITGSSNFETGSQVIEVVPEFIADRQEATFRDVESSSKWSPSDTFMFLEAIKEVLTEEEISGGYLSRKNIFEKVAELLKDQGFNILSTEAEKKYNNMLMTYRRCQKRLMQKRQAPLWPYFKMVVEIQTKFEELESNLTEKQIKRILELERNGYQAKTQNQPSTYAQSYPYVSTFFGGSKTLVPNCLTKRWQMKRAEQETIKIEMMQKVLLDRKACRKRYLKTRRKIHMSTSSENKILSLF